MDLKNIAIKLIQKATNLPYKNVEQLIETPPDPKLGDLAFPCFVLAKKFKKAPAQIAFELREKIAVPKGFKKIEAVGPYLNFFYDAGALAEQVLKQALNKNFGKGHARGKIMIEYSNPNPLKGFHVGHLRNTALGAALCRILEFEGYKVIKANYYNETGSHVSKTLWAYDKWFKGKEKSVKNKGEWIGLIYSKAVQKLGSNPQYEREVKEVQHKIDAGDRYWNSLLKKTRKWSLDEFNRIYNELGASFDKIYFDSEFIVSGKEIVKKLEKHHLVEYETGAPIINLEKWGLGKKALLRSDGTALYITKDLAMAQKRFKEFKLDKLIYVVGAEQDFYFKQLFKTLEILGFSKAKQLYHLSYELVLDKNMKKFSSRLGTAPLYSLFASKAKVLALKEISKRNPNMSKKKQEQLAKKIAIGAMLYLMLNKSNTKRIAFDLDKALNFEGDTGPYLQYSLVRARKIMKKAKTKITLNIDFSLLSSKEEYELLKQISKFPEIVKQSAEQYSPHIIANYSYELAQKFSTFYEAKQVIGAESKTKKARLLLVKAFYETLKKNLVLLGIPEVEAM